VATPILRLGFLSRAHNHQRNSPHQDQPTKHRRYGNVLLLFRRCVNRAYVQNFFPMGVIKTLVS